MIRALLALTPLLIFSTGCQWRCEHPLDCGEGSFCSSSEHRCQTDCFEDIDCRESGKGFRCVQSQGKCVLPPPPIHDPSTPALPPLNTDWDGYNAIPNTGKTFVISHLSVATDDDSPLNVDDRCLNGPCGDNALKPAAGFLNDTLQSGVVAGDSLIVVEIAGLEDEPAALDYVTIKIYGATDADEPRQTSNNFHQPPGASNPCCTFFLDSESAPGGQASARIRARIDHGYITPAEHHDAKFTLAFGPPPHRQITFLKSQITGRLASDGIHGAVLGGAVPMSELALTQSNPFCSAAGGCPNGQLSNGTVLDYLTAIIGQPDIDADGDGVECVLRSGGGANIDGCCDGNGDNACLTVAGECASGHVIPAPDPNVSASCATTNEMVDGYSVALAFDAVPASAVGFR